MVLRFLMPAIAFFFISCGDPERNNPDDPHGINYMGNNSDAVLSSSSSSLVAQSSSSVKVSSSSTPTQSGIIYDTPVPYHDDNYQTIKIGEQIWFQRNLNYDVDGSKCYKDDPDNCAKYGRLYDLATAKTVCPGGWHLPSIAEWTALIDFVGGSSTAGKKLKAKSGWDNDGNGTDEYGFSALPGGYGYSGGAFNYVGYQGRWWSSSEGNSNDAVPRFMYCYNENVDGTNHDENYLFSVRCVKN